VRLSKVAPRQRPEVVRVFARPAMFDEIAGVQCRDGADWRSGWRFHHVAGAWTARDRAPADCIERTLSTPILTSIYRVSVGRGCSGAAFVRPGRVGSVDAGYVALARFHRSILGSEERDRGPSLHLLLDYAAGVVGRGGRIWC
jgi:hypothetical protein